MSRLMTMKKRFCVLLLGVLLFGLAAVIEAKKPHFVEVGKMHEGRAEPTTTLLDDGRVLIAGGWKDYGFALASAEVYDPETRTFTLLPPMRVPRKFHTATKLQDGRVLIVGGNSITKTGLERPPVSLDPVADVEIFDPKTNQFTSIDPMLYPISMHAASLLPDGRVVITGGVSSNQVHDEIVIFEPKTNAFTLWGHLKHKRSEHGMLTLSTGEVLVAGGLAYNDPHSDGPIKYLHSTERIDLNTVANDEFMTVRSILGDPMFLEKNDQVVSPGSSVVLFVNPFTGQFRNSSQSSIKRVDKNAAVELNDKKILLIGGEENVGNNRNVNVAQLYDPQTDVFTNIGRTHQKRVYHSAILLKDGSVLIAGGQNAMNEKLYSEAELFIEK